MHVLILNESEKQALLRSRRVLSKFLPQLGSSTWAGAISEDGLEDLRLALKAAGVSKSTAISCLQVQGRGRLVPRWFLGSKAPFDESGRFAFRQTKARREPQVPVFRCELERFILAILRLAGLAHDTGKASEAFQKKLRKGTGAEALRHDLVSFLVLAESLLTQDVTDKQWLEDVRDNPRLLVSCIKDGKLLPKSSKYLKPSLEALAKAQANGSGEEVSATLEDTMPLLLQGTDIQKHLKAAPALSLLLWLVLTHHRLPNSDQTAQSWWGGRHLNVPRKTSSHTVAGVDACLTVSPGAATPWEDPAWLKAVSCAAESALNALQAFNKLLPSPSDWALIGAHYLRPALILADHLGSQQAESSYRKSNVKSREHIFANTLSSHYYGDTLAQHELKVARLTRSVTRLYEASLPTTTLPEHSLSVVRNLKAPFDWQLHLEDACRKACEHGPVFTSIIGETGSGKTLGGLRAANALSRGKLRITMGLGLRSLTQQSAISAVQDAALPPKDLVVAVGDPQTLALAEKFKEKEAERFGSESAEGSDFGVSLSQTEADLSWLQGFCSEAHAPKLFGAKTLAMLSAPVLVCTTDHLVACATLLKGGDAKMNLRLASSDLLLDEVDSYSAQGLQTIGKLAFIAGLHGRNVTIMSATMSPAVRNGLYQAWARGLSVRSMLKGASSRHACVFSSNTVVSEVAVCESGALSDESWTRYVAKVVDAYIAANAEAPRRKVKEIAINLGGTKNDAFEAAVLGGYAMHQAHSCTDPQTGVRVSTGFILMNTAKDAWDLAKYLSERASDGRLDVQFVAYHSKYPRSYLGVLDANLQTVLNRKSPLEFLNATVMRNALARTHGKGMTDLMVVVCTTTILETGRDFDFDWGIAEPRSLRGETQAVGRIWRHRPSQIATEPNFGILSHPLRALTPAKDPSKESVWRNPGIEDELKGLRVTENLPWIIQDIMAPPLAPAAPVSRLAMLRRSSLKSGAGNGYIRTSKDALPLIAWKAAIHAGPCLLPTGDYASNRIGYLEHQIQLIHLQGPVTWDGSASKHPPTLPHYLNTLAAFNGTHANKTPFRGYKEEQLAFIPIGNKVMYFDEASAQAKIKGDLRRPVANAEVVSVVDDNAFIPSLEQDALTLFTGTDHHIDGCMLRCAWHQGYEKKLSWSPLLGFQEG